MIRLHKALLALSCCFLLSSIFQLSAQNPYELSWQYDLPLLSAGLAGGVLAVTYDFNVESLTLSEINALDKNDVNSFDRKATSFNSASARTKSDILLFSSFSYPFLFLIDKPSRKGFLEIGVMTAEVFLTNSSITALTKGLVKRPRPYVYNPEVDLEKKMSANAQFSFYSGHTSSVSSMTFFSAKVFSDYYPDSKWKPVVWISAALLPVATGYFRVKGGRHFPTDVITGYVTGAIVGYLIPQMHKKKDNNKKVSFSIYPGPQSLGVGLTW